MSSFKETCVAIGVIIFGIIAVIEGLIVLDLVVYISNTGSTSNDRVAVAYDKAYDIGYGQAYEVAYRQAYLQTYDKGYDKGYELGRLGSYDREVASRVELRNPTYAELKEFLAQDYTDSMPYIDGVFVCFDFAVQLNNIAEASGIRAAYVRIRFEDWGHAVVAFDTVDRGMVFIEPQSDKDVKLVTGKPYPWANSGAYRSGSYLDPVVEIQVIW